MRQTQLFICNQGQLDGAPETIKLLPLGLVKSQKGNFYVDEESFREMKNHFEGRGIDIVVDYEHQTLKDVQAPAGGWIKNLFLADGAVCANVQWTGKAKEYLENREYRYLSPVVVVRNSDMKAISLHSVALTNSPAIDGMSPIINAYDPEMEENEGGTNNMELLEKLVAALGLPAEATEEDAVTALTAVIEKSKEPGEDPAAPPEDEDKILANKVICGLLGIPARAKTEDAAAAIVALKHSPAATELAALKLRLDRQDAEQVVDLALDSGKITAAQRPWALQYALKDRSGFDGFMEKAPQVVPMGELGGGAAPQRSTAPSETTLQICKSIGVSAEDIEKYGKEI